jgi:ABC-type multidrug transport system ATPase subunit
MPPGVPAKVKEERVEAILQLLGLTHRADTIVGDALLRGVSGGEKKRVTVGIEWTKSPGVWLFDEPTTGLDSSASYDVMRALRTIVNMGGTGLVSLLQPSYETFHLFDKVMILTRGEIAFLGPRDDALPYFEALGYKCRSTLNPAEFLRTPPPLPNPSAAYSLAVDCMGTEEVVESTMSANPSKYRAVDEAQAEGNDDDNAAAVADEEFEWLEPKDFVAAYKKSAYYSHAVDTISETNKNLAPNPEGDKTDHNPAKIELVDYARDTKYPTSIPTYNSTPPLSPFRGLWAWTHFLAHEWRQAILAADEASAHSRMA